MKKFLLPALAAAITNFVVSIPTVAIISAIVITAGASSPAVYAFNVDIHINVGTSTPHYVEYIVTLDAIATVFTTVIFTPTQAHAMTGEEAVKVIQVIGDYMENLQKIFQPAPPQPQQPTTDWDESQPEPDTTEFESN